VCNDPVCITALGERAEGVDNVFRGAGVHLGAAASVGKKKKKNKILRGSKPLPNTANLHDALFNITPRAPG
jgi:hypothetical protein